MRGSNRFGRILAAALGLVWCVAGTAGAATHNLEWSTFLGGEEKRQVAYGIALDGSGSVSVQSL